MKTVKLTLFALLFSVILPSFAHATVAPGPFFAPYAEMYTVSGTGSTQVDTQFSGNQVPFLYIEFYTPPTTKQLKFLTLSVWKFTGSPKLYPDLTVSTNKDQVWIGFSQNTWNKINTPGTWTITAGSGPLTGGKILGGTTSFTELGSGYHGNPAPEPMGTVLFLIGACVLAIAIIQRKKALSV